MPGAAPTLSEIEQTLESILQPLRDQLARIDDEIATLDERKAELREMRAKVSRIVAANSPRAKSGPKPQPPSKRDRGWIGVAPERIEALHDFLKTNYNGNEFNGPDLLARKDLPGKLNKQSMSKVLAALHDQGALRLVRQGHPDHGNRTKIWRLTDAKA